MASHNSQSEAKNEPIIIVGAGVFGLTTAFELHLRGYSNITVLDRFVPPVPDGSSVDISRIIRSDYADPFYAQMAVEAIEGWASSYSDYYHRTGFVIFSEMPGHPYIDQCKLVLQSQGRAFQEVSDSLPITDVYPNFKANFSGMVGYNNATGGWANAQGAIQCLAYRCSAAGISFVTGAQGTVVSLQRSSNRVTGVVVASGRTLPASKVILATGAWTSQLLNLSHAAVSTGQPVGFIQLTPSEAQELRDMPVIMNFSTGFFVFPPTPDTNVLKLARHGFGYSTEIAVDHDAGVVSSPPRGLRSGTRSFIPDDANTTLRQGLAQLLPQYANHPWMNRRLCWYTDTPEGDFIVDEHPGVAGLFIATGGSGHAFKFLPVLGRYIVDCFENKAADTLRQKWRLKVDDPAAVAKGSVDMSGDGSRAGPPRRMLSRDEQGKL